MIDLSRRHFFFGLGAVAAAAAIPRGVLALASPPPIGHVYLHRRICDVTIGFDPLSSALDEVAEFELRRHGGVIFHGRMSVRGTYRWLPSPTDVPLILPEHPFEIVVKSQTALGQIHMICQDKIDEGPAIMIEERHVFTPGAAPIVTQFNLDLDNSLESRLARKAASEAACAEWERKVAAGEIDIYDDEFELDDDDVEEDDHL